MTAVSFTFLTTTMNHDYNSLWCQGYYYQCVVKVPPDGILCCVLYVFKCHHVAGHSLMSSQLYHTWRISSWKLLFTQQWSLLYHYMFCNGSHEYSHHEQGRCHHNWIVSQVPFCLFQNGKSRLLVHQIFPLPQLQPIHKQPSLEQFLVSVLLQII